MTWKRKMGERVGWCVVGEESLSEGGRGEAEENNLRRGRGVGGEKRMGWVDDGGIQPMMDKDF